MLIFLLGHMDIKDGGLLLKTPLYKLEWRTAVCCRGNAWLAAASFSKNSCLLGGRRIFKGVVSDKMTPLMPLA